jgi:hypothetical protein
MPRRQLSFQRCFWIAIILICIGLPACGGKQKMLISPDVPKLTDGGFRIKGRISYEGNKDYLPRTMVDEASSESPLTFQYIHATSYGLRDVPALVALLNPLTLVGSPLGDNTVTSAGKLSVIKENEAVKSYSAICSMEITRNLYSGDLTFSEMRRTSLIAVRDNIESQLYQDREFLINLNRVTVHTNRLKIQSSND